MSVPDEVYEALFDENVALIAQVGELTDQLAQGLAAFQVVRDERNELRDERKLDIFRATLRRIFDLINIDDPPPNLATRIATFVNNLYDGMYGTPKK